MAMKIHYKIYQISSTPTPLSKPRGSYSCFGFISRSNGKGGILYFKFTAPGVFQSEVDADNAFINEAKLHIDITTP